MTTVFGRLRKERDLEGRHETEYMDSLGFASAMIFATGMDCRNTFGLLKGLRISFPMALMEIRTLTPLGKF